MLGWWDLGVCVIALLASTLIGVYFACHSKGGSSEYLRGSQSMSIFPVALSLIASFVSGVTLLGVPTEIYRHGAQFTVCLLAFLGMGITVTLILIPSFRNLNLESCYQYLELRFNRKVRRMASLLFVINQVLFIPIVIYVPALALSQVTGIHVYVATLGTSVVCIFYTTIGGLRAVVWTDALQTVIMIIAMLAVLVLGVRKVGGLAQVWTICSQGHRLELFDMDPSPFRRHTFWTVLIGSYIFYVSLCGVGQGFVQRYIAVSSLRAAKWTVGWFTFGLIIVVALSCFLGLVIFAVYHNCDPLISGRITHVDQIVPLFLIDVAGDVPGLPGLFVAGIFSSALSTMSTGMNATCGVIVEDILQGKLPKVFSRDTWLRVLAALTGVICTILVLVVEHLGGILQAAIRINGISLGAILGLYLFGLFCPRGSSRAAFAGSVTSLVTLSILVLATQIAEWRGDIIHSALPVSVAGCSEPVVFSTQESPDDADDEDPLLILRLSHMYYCGLGAVLVVLVALPMSLFVPKSDDDVELLPRAELLHPLARRLLPSVLKRETVPLVSFQQ